MKKNKKYAKMKKSKTKKGKKGEKKMRKINKKAIITGVSVLALSAPTFAASFANGTTFNGGTTLGTHAIKSDTVIDANAKSVNMLSIVNGNGNGVTNISNPSGTSRGNGAAISQNLKLSATDEATVAGLAPTANLKIVTTNRVLQNGDVQYANVTGTTFTAAQFAAGTATSTFNLDYDKSFGANDVYMQYVVDENNNVYALYDDTGSIASYRVIKTDDTTPNKVLDIVGTQPGVNAPSTATATTGTNTVNPSDGYVRGNQISYYTAIGQIAPQTISDLTDPNYNTDRANYPVSGGAVHKYLQGDYYNYLTGKFAAKDASNLDPNDVTAWQNKLGVGPSQYDGVIGPKGTPKAEDRAVTGRTVYEYVQPQINNINNRIDSLEDGIEEAKAGAALSTAIANIPDNFREGDLNMFGVGVGYYAGHSAAALGYQRRFSDNSMVIKVSGGFNTKGQFSVGAGTSLSW